MTASPPAAFVRIAHWKIPLPRHRALRLALGIAMLARGAIPTPTSPLLLFAGLTVLSVDSPRLRRVRRKLTIRFARKRRDGN